MNFIDFHVFWQHICNHPLDRWKDGWTDIASYKDVCEFHGFTDFQMFGSVFVNTSRSTDVSTVK